MRKWFVGFSLKSQGSCTVLNSTEFFLLPFFFIHLSLFHKNILGSKEEHYQDSEHVCNFFSVIEMCRCSLQSIFWPPAEVITHFHQRGGERGKTLFLGWWSWFRIKAAVWPILVFPFPALDGVSSCTKKKMDK